MMSHESLRFRHHEQVNKKGPERGCYSPLDRTRPVQVLLAIIAGSAHAPTGGNGRELPELIRIVSNRIGQVTKGPVTTK
jgi:hypothetical protein